MYSGEEDDDDDEEGTLEYPGRGGDVSASSQYPAGDVRGDDGVELRVMEPNLDEEQGGCEEEDRAAAMGMGATSSEIFGMGSEDTSPAHADWAAAGREEATVALSSIDSSASREGGTRLGFSGKNEEQRRRSASGDLLEGSAGDLL